MHMLMEFIYFCIKDVNCGTLDGKCVHSWKDEMYFWKSYQNRNIDIPFWMGESIYKFFVAGVINITLSIVTVAGACF